MDRKRLLLYILALVQFTNIMDFMIMMPLGETLMSLFDINPKQFSLLVSSYTFSAGFSGFMASFVLDRFDRKWALVVIYVGFSLGTIACALSPTYEILLLARALTGIFGGVVGALVLSIVSDLFKYEERGRAMGVMTSAFAVAAVVGVPFGLFLASRLSWHAPFWSMGIMGILINLILLRFMPSMKEHMEEGGVIRNPLKVLGAIFGDANQRNALFLTFVLIMGHFVIIPFIAPFMERNIGFTKDMVTYVYLLGGGLTVFTAPLVGKLCDRYGPLNVFIPGLILSFIPVIWITNLQPGPLPLILTATSLMFIFGGARMIPVQTMVSAAVSPATRGSFMSIRASVQQVSSGLAAYIGGWVILENEAGFLERYDWVGYFSVVVCLGCFLIAPRLKVAEGN